MEHGRGPIGLLKTLVDPYWRERESYYDRPYPISSTPLEDVPKIRCPLLIQSAETDERINASWPAYEEALKAANVTYERHLYPGTQHGFNNNTTPRFDAKAAELAWTRTVAFFRTHLAA